MSATPPGRIGPQGASLPSLRRLLEPLGHRRALATALLFMLTVVPKPVVPPGPGDSLAAPRPSSAPHFACLERLVPVGATVAFFTEPDGTARLEAPMPLYFSQFQLAPRLLVVRPPETWRSGDVDWFLGTVPDPSQARALAAQHGLRVAGQCGPWTALERLR
ncbi:MAG TPA: hypothetical protein P5234_01965 [Thermoanaerobaculaceae bacterium]|nr:hypothetical protein [Thermoanaerobaculaceae bacterium]HRS14994.1 hypothetical protein [Thermoanaerobaculaceae bacterium]